MSKLAAIPLAPLVILLLKWSILLALAWILHGLMRRRDARWRLILWRTVLCLGVSLPFVYLAPLPMLEIPVSSTAKPTFEPRLSSPPETRPGKAFEAPPIEQRLDPTLASTSAKPPQPTHASRIIRPRRAELFGWLWFLGFACAGLRLARFSAHLSRLRRETAPGSPSLQEMVQHIRRELGVHAPVSIGHSDQVCSPFVCGVFKPAILLPAKLSLSAEEMTALLRHEIAHLRRHDLAWNCGWRWMKAICWFHPLVWAIPAAHNLACEEEADRVASGQVKDNAAYAKVLAAIAWRVIALPAVETELALNATSHLVQRLNHLMTGRAGAWTRRQSILACAISGLLALVAGGWNLTPSHAADAKQAAGTKQSELLIVVEDEEGQPVEGAIVRPYAFRVKGPKSVDHYGWDRATRPRLVTDQKGRARLSYPVEAFPKEKLMTGQVSVTVAHPDFSTATAHLPVDRAAHPIRLTRGLVLEVTGYTGTDRRRVPELVASRNLGGEPRVEWTKKDDGVLSCRQVAPGAHILQLMGRMPSGEIVYSEGYAFTVERDAERDTFRNGDSVISSFEKGKPFMLSLAMQPGIRLEGRLDQRVARPVKNGRVVISVRPKQFPAYVVPEEGGDLHSQYGQFEFWTSYRPITEDGTFVFESIPPGEVDVVVLGERFASRNGGQPHNRGTRVSPLIIGVPQAFALREPVTQIEVATEPTATLDVTVKTKSGEPVEGATVYTGPNVMRMQTGYFGGINPSSEAPFRSVEPLSETPAAYSGRTDRNGRVVLSDIPAIADSLNVDHPQFEVPLPRPRSDRCVRFQLTPGQVETLVVTVRRKGLDFIGDATTSTSSR
jgi:beta-lactamase regulating signal transducer with metallopeptidase domain